jgi:hypothetical protein
MDLKGALSIHAKNPYGILSNGSFSEKCSRVKLINCKFDNKGIDFENSAFLYQESPEFLEKCQIILDGFSEFEAENIEFKGSFLFQVPDGFKMSVFISESGALETRLEKIIAPSWSYTYDLTHTAFRVSKSSHLIN